MPRPPNPAADPLYLCIDQGGHASRALVCDARGAVVAEARRELLPRALGDERMEYDAQELLGSVKEAVATVVQDLGDARHRLAAAALATQRSNAACWDRTTGAALSPVISWQDRRAWRELECLRASADVVHRVTGLALSAHYGASKLRWCLQHLPEVAAAQREHRLAWGPMASFLLFHLARERSLYADPVNAARTLLWDLARGDWSGTMLELFQLPREPLPRPVPNRHDHGTLACGGVEIPISVVTGDQNAALFAAGPPRADALYVTLGTGAFVQRLTGGTLRPARRLLNGVVFADRVATTYAIEGTVNGAGSALDWLVARHPGHDLVQQLHQWLYSCPHPPLFLNGVSGLGTPFMLPQFTSRFIGDGGPAERAVAVIESIVFLLQINIEEIERLLLPAAQIHIGGGLSRYDGLCRRLADLSGLPVWRSAHIETTGRGLAWLLHAPGETGGELAAWGGSVQDASVFHPCRDADLSARYLRWRAALQEAITA